MKGERAFGVLTFQQLREGTITADELGGYSALGAVSRTWLGAAYLNDDEARYIELLNEQIDAVELPRDERQAAMGAAWDDIRSSRFRHVMTRMLAPALDRAADQTEKTEALTRCLRVLLALIGEAGGSEQPVDLEQLSLPAEVTIDPFSGGPLLRRRLDDEWIVYSVGENGVHDGGLVESASQPQLDIGLGPLAPAVDSPALPP